MFRIDFTTVFLKEHAIPVDSKAHDELKWVTNEYTLFTERKSLTRPYRLLVGLWSFAAFVRAHRELKTTRPLEFACDGFTTGNYLWAILNCTRIVAMNAYTRDGFRNEDEHVAKVHGAELNHAIGAVKMMLDCASTWKDRGNGEYKMAVGSELTSLKIQYSQLRARMAEHYAWIFRANDDKVAERAKCYRLAHDLNVSLGKPDEDNAADALLCQSDYYWRLGQYGRAIACARSYQKLTRTQPHPDLDRWLEDNKTHHRHEVPETRDWKDELREIEATTYFTEGVKLKPLELYKFVMITKPDQAKNAV